ncbi:3-oxoacyl-[acyl-carrier protein] reductase [Archangium gephyra]|uniref:3-oxoacyl-[acyl-carrier protein] reductase n=1 Tax=Archangium gephyra TaxID=48 RepID=A0AAC8TEC0_9BACT|nr:SDR family NAD(P)-dependent oxidoreductase [Archangium gephyra]AKJ02697.1 3-oxoacyl-[acyl-carrier protein] reductase [Archangium gephyra]REG23242.1 3-oxoacyl-[acyl-carrier protein] reductase [Archangium gephyra]
MGARLNEKLAIVTGASRGIGAAIAEVLAENGFQVALLARDAQALSWLEQKLTAAGARARSFICDVSDEAAVDATLARIETDLGVPGVLVNNAGYGGPFHRADEVSTKEWDTLFGVNVDGVYYLCRWALPRMKAGGYGRIVNISSIQGLFGGARSSTYAATKHALIGYSKTLAVEWGAYGITCNAICPGYIDTEMLAKADPEVRKELLRRIPTGRFGTAEEVARMVAFLVGPHGSYINGSSLVIDGGLSSHLANDVPSF